MRATPSSVLFITLDSCRFDTFEASRVPAMKAVSALYRAHAPSHYTYGSHAAMFVGFTPGVATLRRRFLNPMFGRLFRLNRAGHPGHASPGFSLEGEDIVDGFRRAGYETIGSAAMGWFDPETPVASTLCRGFDKMHFAGRAGVRSQVQWLEGALKVSEIEHHFVFLNVGETHVPYHFEGAAWDPEDNPCQPFQDVDRSALCRERQCLCCEYVDAVLAPLLARFEKATILVCGDHGDCWGEDGVWEHGVSHPMTLTVPLLIRYRGTPIEEVA